MNSETRLDLHVHSFFSDGVLLPSEILRRAAAKGYGAIAVTDHADASNLDEIVSSLVRYPKPVLPPDQNRKEIPTYVPTTNRSRTLPHLRAQIRRPGATHH